MNDTSFRSEVMLGIEEAKQAEIDRLDFAEKIKKEADEFYFKNIFVFENEIVKKIPEASNLTKKILDFIKCKFIEFGGDPFELDSDWNDIVIYEKKIVVEEFVRVEHPNKFLRSLGFRKYETKEVEIDKSIKFINDILNDNKDYLYSLYNYLLKEYGILMYYSVGYSYDTCNPRHFSELEITKSDVADDKFTIGWYNFRDSIDGLLFSFQPPLYKKDNMTVIKED
jgi:hypothetical protein